MCGITGFLNPPANLPTDAMRPVVEAMADTLRHRGPDDDGAWIDTESGVGLGFRRLSILDLSNEGHQPMESADKRYVMVFNGEIYNFRELRDELCGRGHRFRGRSDSEVLLAALVEWGVRGGVRRLNGMFAIACWDRRLRVMHLVRDRLGKKPLYYGWMRGTFLFGSELKALRAHPSFRGEIDRGALRLFLKHGYIPAPHTIFQNVRKLPAGTTLEVLADGRCGPVEPYWSLERVAEDGAARQFAGTAEEALDELADVLRDAVRLRLVSDVPLGGFLSGGTDSSLIVALMQAESTAAVKTFTVGFREGGFDETPAARAVAQALGTQHTEIYVSPSEARQVIPKIPDLYDEPFADSSQIPTHLIAELARQEVTVCLSGDGGDELFGGYGRYFLAQRLWSRIRRIPRPARPGAALAARAATVLMDATALDRSRDSRRAPLGDRGERMATMLASASPAELYERITSVWADAHELVIGAEPHDATGEAIPDEGPFMAHMMLRDGLGYLPDDILTKVDRASMGTSLEVRCPILDPRVVELAWRLPLGIKVRGQQGKWPLKQLLARFVPEELVDRPKQGFDVPIAEWLRGPLRGWAEALLNESRLLDEGYLHPEPIQAKWEQHLSGQRNWQHQLWTVLMFEAWLDAQPA